MPSGTLTERRDGALFAFALITAARIGALASFRLKHVDLANGTVHQDARLVRTKAAKSFVTFFMPVDENGPLIVASWFNELVAKRSWGPDDPLFPATEMGLSEQGNFEAVGLSRRCWASSQPIRCIFQRAFSAARLPYFNPHSFRDMLVRHVMSLNLSPEVMKKAWSQNLRHADVLTTFTSYGSIPAHLQGQLIRQSEQLARPGEPTSAEKAALEAFLVRAKRESGQRKQLE